jgi:hypothetical protein
MKTEAKERMLLILAPHWLCLFYIEKGQSFMLMQIAKCRMPGHGKAWSKIEDFRLSPFAKSN